MRRSSRNLAVLGIASALLSCVGATVWAFPVPPIRDEAQMLKASALDPSYGVNGLDAKGDCRLVPVAIVGADGIAHGSTIQECD